MDLAINTKDDRGLSWAEKMPKLLTNKVNSASKFAVKVQNVNLCLEVMW